MYSDAVFFRRHIHLPIKVMQCYECTCKGLDLCLQCAYALGTYAYAQHAHKKKLNDPYLPKKF